MKEFFPAPSSENQSHPQTQNSRIELQELLATIGELHVSNRRMLMQIDEMAKVITELRLQNQTLNAKEAQEFNGMFGKLSKEP